MNEVKPILLGPKEVCRVLGVSMTMLYRDLRKNPDFPKPIYAGDRPKWRVAALEEWAAKLQAVEEAKAAESRS